MAKLRRRSTYEYTRKIAYHEYKPDRKPGMSNSLFDWNQNSNEMKDCCYCLVAK